MYVILSKFLWQGFFQLPHANKKEPNLLKKLKSPKGCCHFGDIIVAKYGVMTP